MDMRESHTYPGTLDDLWAMQTSAEYQKEKLTAIGNGNVEIVECGPSGSGFKLVIKMDVTADMPGFVAKVLPATNRITQTWEWNNTTGDERTGSWKVDSGTPVQASGTMSLKADGDKTVETIIGKVKCGIPLVGGKIADFVGNAAADGVRKDQAYTDAKLTAK